MITEIVTYGTLSLPSSLAVVGIVPGVILIAFLGIFALYTSLVLIQFKLNHPEGKYFHLDMHVYVKDFGMVYDIYDQYD